MAVFQGNDGYLTFSIQANKENQDMFLLPIKDYIGLLNNEDTAYSLINKDGLITTADVQGSFISTSDGVFTIAAGNEFNPLVYRGQNKDYDFIPSSKRYELSSGEERVRHAIDWVKKKEFLNLFVTTPYSKRIESFNVLGCKYKFDLEAVAQNYNFVSDYLDMTKNLMAAYFFAYTYVDSKTGKIMPVEDFSEYSPTLYIGNIARLYAEVPETVQGIGMQALLRSKTQLTMSLNVGENSGVKSLFKKVELPKNPAVSRNLFAQFRGGEMLFPSDYLSKCSLQIRSYKVLNESLINQYCAETSTDQKWLVDELKKMGYEIVNQPWDIPEQARYMINREIDEFIIPFMNSNVAFRGCKKAETVKS